MFNLSGKVILITGGSSGIGRECARVCSSQGATLVIFGRDKDRLSETVSLCEHPSEHITVSLDLCNYEQVETALEESHKSLGPFSGLVHASGISTTQPLTSTRPEKIDNMFAVNVTSGINLTKYAVKRKYWSIDGGSVVFISSVMGIVGEKGKLGYSLTKSALLGGARCLALELASRKIRVNAISPGVVRTPLSDAAVYSQNEKLQRDIESMHPLGLGQTGDVAHASVFLLSDEASWITGTNLVVDGGYCAR